MISWGAVIRTYFKFFSLVLGLLSLSACGGLESDRIELASGLPVCSISAAATRSQDLKGYSTERKVIELHESTGIAALSLAGEREYVVLYDTKCLGSPQMMAKAVFGSQVKTRKQRYQAEKVSIQQALLSSMGSVLAEDPCLVGLTPNMIFQSTSLDTARAVDTSGEPLLSQQMHLSQLGASDLWNYVFQGLYSEKVKVAVIDSGVNLAHEDLREILWEDAEGVGRNFINPFASAQDDNGHGTHVAGLIAASGTNARGGSGVAPDGVEIMALKALNDDGSGNLFTIINAINWAVENGANVINLSLGGPGTNTLIRAAIEEAVKQGVFVVAAAGNDTKEISVANAFSPAMYAKDIDGFISVGSVDSDTGGISWFSNYSSTFVEVLAPGSQSASLGLLSTVGVEGFETYDRLFGTSMSAPLVAGTAALIYRVLKQNDVQPKPEVIEEYIRRFSRSDTLLRNYSVEGRTLDLKLLAQGLKGQLGSGTCP